MTTNKRILLYTAVLTLLLSVTGAGAVPPRELEYAYLNTQSGYLIVGREAHFEVILPEGASGYTFEFNTYYAEDRETDNQFMGIDRVKAQPEPTYVLTPQNPGQYFLEVIIMDADYCSLTLQSEPFYRYPEGSEADPSTLPGKVMEIAQLAENQGFTTQYDKALFLHDWLTHNADYDEPMTIHTPEGVLLQGKGVCESYALAYQMLLRQVGVTSQYVTAIPVGNCTPGTWCTWTEWTHRPHLERPGDGATGSGYATGATTTGAWQPARSHHHTAQLPAATAGRLDSLKACRLLARR